MKPIQIITRVLITLLCVAAVVGAWAFFAWGLIYGALWARDGQEATTPWFFVAAGGVTYGAGWVIVQTWRPKEGS